MRPQSTRRRSFRPRHAKRRAGRSPRSDQTGRAPWRRPECARLRLRRHPSRSRRCSAANRRAVGPRASFRSVTESRTSSQAATVSALGARACQSACSTARARPRWPQIHQGRTTGHDDETHKRSGQDVPGPCGVGRGGGRVRLLRGAAFRLRFGRGRLSRRLRCHGGRGRGRAGCLGRRRAPARGGGFERHPAVRPAQFGPGVHIARGDLPTAIRWGAGNEADGHRAECRGCVPSASWSPRTARSSPRWGEEEVLDGVDAIADPVSLAVE